MGLGERFDIVWSDGWEQAKPIIADAMAGRSERFVDLPWTLDTDRGAQDTWWTFSYSRVLDENGAVAGLFIFTNETTDRILGDAALKESRAQLAALNAALEQQVKERSAELRLYGDIVRSSAAPICAFDTDYRLIAFNQAYSDELFRVFAYRMQIGDVLPDLFPPDQAPVIRAFMARALTGEAYTVTEKFGDPTLVKPYWEVSYSPLRDAKGQVIGAFHHAKDVSERLRAEAALASTQEALRQSQKMKAVGQLTGGLAHDFNNLLAGISGSLELMGKRIEQGRYKDVEKYLAAAQGASKRAAALTHRLLAFSRRQTLGPKVTDIGLLVTGMLDMIRRTVGPSIEVEYIDLHGLWTVLVDPSQLENALLNLCINARDALPNGGRIVIEASHRDIDQTQADLRDMSEGQFVALFVSDNGTGMTPEIVERAFDPFFTTKPMGEGTGLGLSMIYGFAKQSGGQVRIHSQAGVGTTVTILLPHRAGEAEVNRDTPSAGSIPTGRAEETVLIVEDEPTVRMLATDLLLELGYTAIEAVDGAGGLKILRSDIRIDLLVTDDGLPGGMNGRQMADAARVFRPGLKVLFITGFAESTLLNNGQLETGMAVLTKPFSVDVLGARIREMISG